MESVNSKTLFLTLALSTLAHAQAETYTVRPGDTLSKIAYNAGIPVSKLKQTNDLTGNRIYPGQVLNVPSLTGLTFHQPSTHRVRAGDTLWDIAQKYKLSTARLKALNNLKDSIIQPDQILSLHPDVPPSKPQRASLWKRKTHEVQAGDTLYDLARAYQTSVKALMRANGLNTAKLYPGQVLTLPLTTPSEVAQPRTGLFKPRSPEKGTYLEEVGYEPQTMNNCGPAAVASVLKFFGEKVTQRTYQTRLRPEGEYTSAQDIASLLQDLGYSAPLRSGGSLAAIRRELDKGRPVLVLQYHEQVGKTPHWRVVRGYQPGLVIMSDSLSGPNVALTDQDFVRLWQGLGHIYIPVGNPA